MPTLLLAFTMPEVAALSLAVGVPMAFALLALPYIKVKAPPPPPPVEPIKETRRLQGLEGQWARIELGCADHVSRQSAAAILHSRAAIRIDALDYEIDQLWREVKAVGRGDALSPPPDFDVNAARTARPSGRPRSTGHRATAPRDLLLAS